MRPSLFTILNKRLHLFFRGNRSGVSVSYLAQYSDGVLLNAEELVKRDLNLFKPILEHQTQAKSIYQKLVDKESNQINDRWNAGLQLTILLYSIVRSLRVNVIVETGVANGITTNTIMQALMHSNSTGELHSFDILPETKGVYDGLGNWHFHLLNPKSAHKEIWQIVSKLPNIDIWLHDSNHGYRWQRFEYELAFSKLRKGGILVSDDIDATSAWTEVTSKLFSETYIIFDNRKFVGIAIK
jgi:predicted O-methyltransferase YrrM